MQPTDRLRVFYVVALSLLVFGVIDLCLPPLRAATSTYTMTATFQPSLSSAVLEEIRAHVDEVYRHNLNDSAVRVVSGANARLQPMVIVTVTTTETKRVAMSTFTSCLDYHFHGVPVVSVR